MAGLLEQLQETITPSMLAQLSKQVGANEAQTTQAVSALIPMLIGGMASNVQQSSGAAQSLNQALEKDHDGSLLDQLPALLGAGASSGLAGGLMSALSGTQSGGSSGLMGALGSLLGGSSPVSERTVNADGILNHVFGQRRTAVQQGVSKASGLDAGTVGQLMTVLAPMVMGALGKAKRQQNLDANGVADLLKRERSTIEEQTPGTEQGSLLGLLDSNNDGKVDLSDDIAKVGMALGGAFLLSRRNKN